MTKLHNLKPSKNQSKKAIRRGRGNSTGKGTFSGRGVKGQTARSGGKRRPGFEGGQTPLYMKLPKLKGFRNINRVEYKALNFKDINEQFGEKSKITKQDLIESRFIKVDQPVKLLATGSIDKKIEIEVDKASKKAIEMVEKAGGKVTVLKAPKEKKEPKKKKTKAKAEEPESSEEASEE